MTTLTPEQIWQKLRPYVAKAIVDSLSSATLTGISISIPDYYARKDQDNTFLGANYFLNGLQINDNGTVSVFILADETGAAVFRSRTTTTDGIVAHLFTNDARAWQLRLDGSLGDIFSIYDDTATAHRLTINASGYVGISDTNADSALEIAAMSGAGYITLNEITAPSSPASTKLAVYAVDGGTPTYLATKDNAGNVITLRPMAASGTNHAPGLVPDTPASSGTTKYLCEDGTWSVPASSGSVTFNGARVRRTTDKTVSNGTSTAIDFDAERFDTNAYHDNATNNTRLTAPSTGYYMVVGHITVIDEKDAGLFIRKNGSTYVAVGGKQNNYPSGSTWDSYTVSTIVQLTATDYVELIVRNDSGGDITVKATGEYTPEFSIALLGT